MRILVVAFAILLASTASAHPVPKLEYDRQIDIAVSPGEIAVEYRLEIDAFTLFQEVGRKNSPYKFEAGENQTREDFAKAMLARLRKTVPDGLFAKIDGSPLKWNLKGERVDFLDSVQFHFRFIAAIPDSSALRKLQFEDLNFADKNGLLKLGGSASPNVKIAASNLPMEVRIAAGDGKRHPIHVEFEGTSNTAKISPIELAAEEPASPEQLSLWSRVRRQGLAALLESSEGLAILLLVAALFGAAHALTPGHGKTLVAAYLVGERGTKFHAILLGIVTTISHTGGVILIALLLWVFYPQTAPNSVRVLLGVVGGLLIAGLGLWLLLQRLLGRADHVHLPGIGHSHGAPVDNRKATIGRLILLGITGGMIPCWDAVLLLGVSISMQKVWLGVPLLIAFSAGLAGVLVAIGLGVVYAGQKVGGRWAESRVVKALPIISALIVIAIGLWLCGDSLSPPD